ncbi:TonB-dependent receptor [bacterium]|nr:TonB-dependent receptor [bacterium]
MRNFGFIFLVLGLLISTVYGQTKDVNRVTGKVQEPSGDPIPQATVSVHPLGVEVNSDDEGNFVLTLPEGTYTVFVEAPGFEIRGETITTKKEPLHLNMVLHPKHLQFEEIVIGTEDSSGASVSSPSTSIQPAKEASPTSVLDAVQDIPSVAPLGQGGLFQVPSIRGSARERTILLFESVRITSERRTGPSFSFVDALFLDRIDVTRGPAPVLYGSNGESGLIHAFALEPSSTSSSVTFRTGYQSNLDENWQALTYKDGTDRFQYVLGAVRRESGDFESGDGQEFPSSFKRLNFLAKGRWFSDAGTLTFLVLPTWTQDIEKASSDAVTSPTLYPEENHQIYAVDWQNPLLKGVYDFQVQAWLHPNDLIARDENVSNGVVTARNIVFNDTDDFGVRFRVGRAALGNWRFWTGVDYFARANVNARQESFEPSLSEAGFDQTGSFFSIKDGSYNITGLFLTSSVNLGKMLTNGGLRLQRVHTANHAEDTISDSEYGWSGNFGGDFPLNSNWDVVWNVGRGLRPATISEKFFTGETGRGSITGNPKLKTESNFEFDGGIRYHRDRKFAAFYLFRNDVEEFIARVRLADGSFTYQNLQDVVIYGIEGEGYYDFNTVRIYSNFHVIRGHDGNGADINDIPPSRMIAGLQYSPQDFWWNGSVELVRQFEKTDSGPDEAARDAALILNTKMKFFLNDNLSFFVSGFNLTNETYFDSADNRAPLAYGRSFSIELLTQF